MAKQEYFIHFCDARVLFNVGDNVTHIDSHDKTENNYITTEIVITEVPVETTTTAGVGTENGFAYSLENGQAIVTKYTGTETEVRIPEKIAGVPVKVIGKEAFYGTSITHIVIPEGVTHIGEKAFAECDDLEFVRLPSSLQFIGYRAFHNRESVDCTIHYPGNSDQWDKIVIQDEALGDCELIKNCDQSAS